jgi:hypothetical protein
MFTGINKEIQKIVSKINQNDSPKFCFSFADLELIKKDGKRKKCRLLSKELSQKLHQIYSEDKSGYVPPIEFIEFGLVYDCPYIIFPNDL